MRFLEDLQREKAAMPQKGGENTVELGIITLYMKANSRAELERALDLIIALEGLDFDFKVNINGSIST
jgi:hypothetical protein